MVLWEFHSRNKSESSQQATFTTELATERQNVPELELSSPGRYQLTVGLNLTLTGNPGSSIDIAVTSGHFGYTGTFQPIKRMFSAVVVGLGHRV